VAPAATAKGALARNERLFMILDLFQKIRNLLLQLESKFVPLCPVKESLPCLQNIFSLREELLHL